MRFVGIGKVTNAWALLWAIIGSIILIVTADEVPDIVLNSTALMFIISIDDDLVTDRDYQFATQILKKRKANVDKLWNYPDEMDSNRDFLATLEGFSNCIKRIVKFICIPLMAINMIYIPLCKNTTDFDQN